MKDIVDNIVLNIRSKMGYTPDVAVILGSGLSDILDLMSEKVTIPYSELPQMPTTNVSGHKNQFVCGILNGKKIIAMQGRFHLYDGFSAKQVSLPIYIFKQLGVKTLIVTNAGGGINKSFAPGDLMLIEDHINNTCTNAMIGGPIIDFGEKFIDMTEPYDVEYRDIVTKIARDNDIDLKSGTYIQFVGPFYETKADIKMACAMGADCVGMSTVIEVETARQCNMRVLGISLISNMATGISKSKLSHSEVLQAGNKASKNFTLLISEFLKKI